MARGQLREILGRGFVRVVAADLEPGVLVNDGLQLGRAFHDGVEFGGGAGVADPQFRPDHWALGHTTVQFGERRLDMLGVEVDEAERAVGKPADGLQHLVVIPAEDLRRRIRGERHAQVNAQPVNPHPVGDGDHPGQTFLGRDAVNA